MVVRWEMPCPLYCHDTGWVLMCKKGKNLTTRLCAGEKHVKPVYESIPAVEAFKGVDDSPCVMLNGYGDIGG